MKAFLRLIGIILLAAGIIFMGQGSGWLPYPAESFMVGAFQWVYYGAAIAASGVLVIVFSRKAFSH